MMLETNGTVLVQGGGVSKEWYQLTPDSSGNYVKGTWSQLASMSTERLYVASNVLQDGRIFALGGEYSGPDGDLNDNNTGDIYNPITNTWTTIAQFPKPAFGDDPSVVLGNGQVLCGFLEGPETYPLQSDQ